MIDSENKDRDDTKTKIENSKTKIEPILNQDEEPITSKHFLYLIE